MRAWAFYRRSTDKQELSIEDQRRECRAFAASQGWIIVREFEPSKGFGSGLTIDRDATFQEMIRTAELGDHGVRHLITYDVSRFGRLATEDKIYWEQRFKKQGGIQIVYVKDGFKNDGSIGDVLNKVVQHSGAHEYSRKLSEVTLRGSKSRAALGHSTGGPAPYGYSRLLLDGTGNPVRQLQPGERAPEGQHVTWSPSPSEATTVRTIFEQYSQGIGLKRLAEQLNAHRIPPPSSTRSHRKTPFWCKSTIHAILRNRVYVGDRVYNRSNCKGYRRGEGGPFRKPSSEWIIKESAHEAIITRSLFDNVQTSFKSRAFRSGRSYARPYLLTGLLKCEHCGYNLSGSMHDGRRRCGCSGYNRIGTSVCRNYYLLADEIEAIALEAIRTQNESAGWKLRVKTILEQLLQGETANPLTAQVDDVRRKLHEVTRHIENVVTAIQKTGFSEALEQSLSSLERRRNDLRTNLDDIEKRAQAFAEADRLYDRVFALAQEFDALWETASVDEKKIHLRDFIYGVTVDPDGPEIKATYHIWAVPGMGKEIAPPPATMAETERSQSLKYVAGAGLEPATYSL